MQFAERPAEDSVAGKGERRFGTQPLVSAAANIYALAGLHMC